MRGRMGESGGVDDREEMAFRAELSRSTGLKLSVAAFG